MSNSIKIKRGLDIKLKGKAQEQVQELSLSNYALKPTDFHGMFPKLSARVGDKVKRGSIVFFDKKRDYIQIPSPVSGTVTEVVRGAKRKMLEVRIEADGNDDYLSFKKINSSEMNNENVKSNLLESGLWSLIRQRPYNVVAKPTEKAKAIFISGFDSAPLAANVDFILKGNESAFQAGIDALSKLSDGKVYLGVNSNTKSQALLNAKGVEINKFDGPHPSGNVGIQIHHISPINKGEIVWTIQAQDVVTIGNLFLTGEYKSEITIAIAGSRVQNPQYYKINRGGNISEIVNGKLINDNDIRIISGNVLTGEKVDKSGSIGYYHNLITVIPEGNKYAFFGWLIPSPNKHSVYRTAFSWLSPNKEFDLNTNLNGGERAFVFTGNMDKVLPMDILPLELTKAIIVDDIDMMENLGIYEVDEEDFALCEYVNTSKIEIQSIIRKGLDAIRKEMS